MNNPPQLLKCKVCGWHINAKSFVIHKSPAVGLSEVENIEIYHIPCSFAKNNGYEKLMHFDKSPKANQMITVDMATMESIVVLLSSLTMYIECLHPEKPLLWFADGKTPVVELPDFKAAKKMIANLKTFIDQNNA